MFLILVSGATTGMYWGLQCYPVLCNLFMASYWIAALLCAVIGDPFSSKNHSNVLLQRCLLCLMYHHRSMMLLNFYSMICLDSEGCQDVCICSTLYHKQRISQLFMEATNIMLKAQYP